MKAYLEFIQGASRKFWHVEVSGKRHTVTFGRIGSSGQSKTKTFASPQAASTDAKKLVASKLAKGYSTKKAPAAKAEAAPKTKTAPKTKAAPTKAKAPKARVATRQARTSAASDAQKALVQVFAAFGKLYWGSKAPPPMPFTLTEAGADLSLRVDSRFGQRRVQGRASAIMALAGSYFACSLPPDLYRLCPVFVPTLGRTMELEFTIVQPMAELGIAALKRGATAEGVLTLRRAYIKSSGFGDDIDDPDARIAKETIKQIAQTSPLSKTMESLDCALTTAVKTILPYAKKRSVIDRLTAALLLNDVVGELSYSNHLRFAELASPGLLRLADDAEPYVQEAALTGVEALGFKLFQEQAYAECRPLLDVQIRHGINVGSGYHTRWETLAALGDDDGATRDLAATELLSKAGGTLKLAGSMFAVGDHMDFVAAGWSRLARAHALWASGADPCDVRPKKGRRKLTEMERAQHLAKAEAFMQQALEIVRPRVARDLAKARKGKTRMDNRVFQVDTFVAQSVVAEARGDQKAALAHLRFAKETRNAFGWTNRMSHIDQAIRRLSGPTPTKSRAKR